MTNAGRLSNGGFIPSGEKGGGLNLPAPSTTIYTDSKPREPDYTDTSLPLQGWSERKEVVDRVTLAQEGLELAAQAGLVGDDADQQAPERSPPALEARDLGHGLVVSAEVWNVSTGEYNREAQGLLKGPHGTVVGFVIPGGNKNQVAGRQGDRVELENVTLRTDEDGLREVVINDSTMVTVIDSPSSTSTEREAAADGSGEETDQLTARILSRLRNNYREDQIVAPSKLAGEVSEDPDRVKTALEGLSGAGRMLRPKGDGTGRYLVG